jgi:hypothetical protein
MPKSNGPGAAATAHGTESVEAGAATPLRNPVITEEQWQSFVRHYVPNAIGDELAYRVAILKARDWAAVLRGSTVSQRALSLAIDAHEAAGEYVFEPGASVEQLASAARACRRLVGAALDFELLENGEVARDFSA